MTYRGGDWNKNKKKIRGEGRQKPEVSRRRVGEGIKKSVENRDWQSKIENGN